MKNFYKNMLVMLMAMMGFSVNAMAEAIQLPNDGAEIDWNKATCVIAGVEDGGNIGGTKVGATVTFTINNTVEQGYKMAFKSTMDRGDAMVEVKIAALDGTVYHQQNVDIANTGGWSNYNNTHVLNIESLPVGESTLVFTAKSSTNSYGYCGNWNNLTFEGVGKLEYQTVTYYNEAYTTDDATYTEFKKESVVKGSEFVLSSTSPAAPAGFKFDHWADKTGTTLASGGAVDADIFAYPVWVDNMPRPGIGTSVTITNENIFNRKDCVAKGEWLIDSSSDSAFVDFPVYIEEAGTYTFTSNMGTSLDGIQATLGYINEAGEYIDSKRIDIANNGSWTVGEDYTWTFDLEAATKYIFRMYCHTESQYCLNVYALSVTGTEKTPTGIADITVSADAEIAPVYNLQGQRVYDMKKGNIYIKNGVKFVK